MSLSTPTSSGDDLETVTVTAHNPALDSVRQPRAIVKLGDFGKGKGVSGWIEWTVSNNTYFEADTFHVSYAVSLLPEANNANWFSRQTETYLEILAGFPTNPDNPDESELKSLIYGRIDDIEYDPCEQMIHLTGRDLTAAFIDDKTPVEFINAPASGIVKDLAIKHNLSYQVTDTTTFCGIPDQNGIYHLKWTQGTWDLIVALAKQEGFIAYAAGTKLYFGPDNADPSNPYELRYKPADQQNASPTLNAMALSFSRSQTVAKGITVTVRAAGLYHNKTVSESYPRVSRGISPGRATPFGDAIAYTYVVAAGTSPDQAQRRAQEIYNSIIQHEMKLTARLPADNLLSAQSTVRVGIPGTGTAFDQIYYPRVVTRTMSMEGGYEMTVEAQNTSPAVAPAPPPTGQGGVSTGGGAG